MIRELFGKIGVFFKRALSSKVTLEPQRHSIYIDTDDSGQYESSDRVARLIEWCRRFNSRNNHIVPEKSPRSIYMKAMRPRRRVTR